MLINYREKFPIFKQKKQFIYLDSACITLIPQNVLDSINRYYTEYSGCHGRGGHLFGDETSRRYSDARIKIQKFINASNPEEIIFTRNTTEGINLAANSLNFNPGDIILTSDIEHNSNLLPWQYKAALGKIKHHIFLTNNDTSFDLEKFKKCLNKDVKLISILHISNLTGVKFPIQGISDIVHENGSYLMIDAAQSLSSEKIDVQKMGIDILVSSIHKNFGPSGVGFIYIHKSLLEQMYPFMLGGETVQDASYETSEYAPLPYKFEAGLQNYAGVIGSKESINFIEDISIEKISEHKIKLNSILTENLRSIPGIVILGPKEANLRGGICNFFIEGINSFDISKIISESKGIMLRPGYHCVHAWFHKNNIQPSLRISLQIYNTEEEMNIVVETIKNIAKHFR
ncbi:aminotransferase class V-fold PLP-dependent enzyme [Candidatus Poribacteria bacterium]|nr:aminotransferase class V-fold PLP-dependent enzyme [Candidatus Poribacteria bacterium]